MTLSEIPAVVVSFVILYSVIAAAWVAYLAARSRRRIPERLVTPLVLRWKGRAVGGDLEFEPLVEIESDGVPGEVSMLGGPFSWPGRTRVRFHWPSWRRLRVAPRNVGTWLRGIVGGTQVEVGDPEFDRAFWVESSDGRWAKSLLDPMTRRAFMELRRMGVFGRSDVMLDLGSEGLTLRLGRLLWRKPEMLENFVALAASILARARATAAPDVEISPTETHSGSGCPVCGTPVQNGVKCPQCGTPHHEDCWKYSGGCALFACAGRAGHRV